MSEYNIAEIDLNLLENNIKIIRSITGKVKLLSIVKADAYGHGIVEMSKQLEKLNVDALGVATVEEGVKIRESGVKLPIIVLFQHFKNESEAVCQYNLTPIINNSEFLEDYNKFIKKNKLKLYIKIDTGLSRMGVKPNDVVSLAKKVMTYENLCLEGISTHYAAADVNEDYAQEFTLNQIKEFNKALSNLQNNGIKVNTAHTANSAAIVSYKDTYFDMIRSGIIMYGYPYSNENNLAIKPILNLKSKVSLIKKLKKGESVGYGMTWKADKDSRIAIVPIGYADGISRALSNNWEVKIRNKYYPLRGRVFMDCILIEIYDNNIEIEDDVLIFGNDEKLNAASMAKRIGTISHEVLVNIGNRVKRVYKK